jgi:uncharacterized protein YkwD
VLGTLRSIRWLLGVLACASVTLAPALARPVAAEPLAIVGADPAAMTLLTVEQTMLDLTNADRLANGLPPLEFDPATLAIARARAARQLGSGALSHYDGDGELAFVRLLAESRLGYQLAGENLARASASDSTLMQRIEQALMQSPTHRENILERKFSRVAIGAATDASGRVAFAEIFRSTD